MSDIRPTRQEIADEQARQSSLPATRGDIERLIRTVEAGWIGRGFAIGFGVSIFTFVVGLVLALIVIALAHSSTVAP